MLTLSLKESNLSHLTMQVGLTRWVRQLQSKKEQRMQQTLQVISDLVYKLFVYPVQLVTKEKLVWVMEIWPLCYLEKKHNVSASWQVTNHLLQQKVQLV